MSMLNARAVRVSSEPRYPTCLDVRDLPALLRRHQPRPWLSRSEMAGAVAAMLAVGPAGCSRQVADNPADSGTRKADPPATAVVAPVFDHGDGRGAVGCIVVSPPAFMSEEEAISIIREELSRAGVDFAERNVAMTGVEIPGREIEYGRDWESDQNDSRIVEKEGEACTLVVDLLEPDRKVAVEFVSRDDHLDLGGTSSRTTVSSYDFKELAENVKKHVEAQGQGVYMGVFYDPLTALEQEVYQEAFEKFKADAGDDQKAEEDAWREAIGVQRRHALDQSAELLRSQVKDFVDWLKGQGVI